MIEWAKQRYTEICSGFFGQVTVKATQATVGDAMDSNYFDQNCLFTLAKHGIIQLTGKTGAMVNEMLE